MNKHHHHIQVQLHQTIKLVIVEDSPFLWSVITIIIKSYQFFTLMTFY